jgi:hypothetical protein
MGMESCSLLLQMAMMDSGWIIAPTVLANNEAVGRERNTVCPPENLDAVPHATNLQKLSGRERLRERGNIKEGA